MFKRNHLIALHNILFVIRFYKLLSQHSKQNRQENNNSLTFYPPSISKIEADLTPTDYVQKNK